MDGEATERKTRSRRQVERTMRQNTQFFKGLSAVSFFIVKHCWETTYANSGGRI